MSRKLEEILQEYSEISRNGFKSRSKNKYLREIELVAHGVKFVLTKYFRDEKIKQLKEEHTQAVYLDLVEEEKVPFNLATKIAKAAPMPVQSEGGKAIICALWGVAGPGRTYYDLFKHSAKYSGLKEKWLFRGSIFSELALNNWSGTWLTGSIAYPIDKLTNYIYKNITGDNTEIPITEIAMIANIALSYVETLTHWAIYELKGKYNKSIMLWTRAPSNILFQYPAYLYEKHLKNHKISKSTQTLNT